MTSTEYIYNQYGVLPYKKSTNDAEFTSLVSDELIVIVKEKFLFNEFNKEIHSLYENKMSSNKLNLTLLTMKEMLEDDGIVRTLKTLLMYSINNSIENLVIGKSVIRPLEMVIDIDDIIVMIKNDIYKIDTSMSSDEITCLLTLLKDTQLSVDDIKNRDLKRAFMIERNLVPSDPEEFIKHLITVLTGKATFVKNEFLYSNLKTSDTNVLIGLINSFNDIHGAVEAINQLSTIFNRYKRVFISLKKSEDTSWYINKVSKASKVNHVPITLPWKSRIIKDNIIDEKLISSLSLAELAKIDYNIKMRGIKGIPKMFRIRNGSTWITDKEQVPASNELIDIIDKCLINNLIKYDLSYDFSSKVKYGIPFSGKQFIGDIPFGTIITPESSKFIIGIYWENIGDTMVDLDLSLTNKNDKLGWDSHPLDSDSVFSGDVTTADNGACELFRINTNTKKFYTINVNIYNHENSVIIKNGVKFRFFIMEDTKGDVGKDLTQIPDGSMILDTEVHITGSKSMTVAAIFNNQVVIEQLTLPGNSTTSTSHDSRGIESMVKGMIESRRRFTTDKKLTKSDLVKLI